MNELLPVFLFFGTFWLILIVLLVEMPRRARGLTPAERAELWHNYRLMVKLDNDEVFDRQVALMRDDDRYTQFDIVQAYSDRATIKEARAKCAKVLGIKE